MPHPGFYFGRGGKPAPREVVRKGYGRVRFGHSELTGFQLWDAAADEGAGGAAGDGDRLAARPLEQQAVVAVP